MNLSLLEFYRHDGTAYFKKHQATFEHETAEQLFDQAARRYSAVNHPTRTFCFVTLYEKNLVQNSI